MRLLKKIESLIKTPIIQYIKYKKLKKYNYIVKFLYEGGIEIKVPNLSIGEVLLSYGINIKRNLYMMGRPHVEVLLRNIIYKLYKDEYINKNFSIVDIGSWIGDNGLVWAQNLTGDAKVFCIEPSRNNLTYSKKCAQLNNINNIEWYEKVCSDRVGEKLIIDSKTKNSSDNHKYKSENSEKGLSSTTLDEIINEKKNTNIGLIHIDVEGFELKVIKGAKKIIERDKPVLTFEQHISNEDTNQVFEYLKNFGYRIFMINEVIPGNELDCRNFLAFHSSKKLPNFSKFKENNLKNLNFYQATIGPGLIEL